MNLLKNALALGQKIRAISLAVLARHIQRESVVKATWLALVSGRPAFFLGDPGVDKTGTIQAMVKWIVGAEFYDALMPTIVSVEQLLVESTSIIEEPTADGGKSIRTSDKLGRAAAAHAIFADEIWKSEPRVLQTLLDLAKGDGVRHEGQMVATPLLAFLAASNELPSLEDNLGAIWSRMTIRVEVVPLDRTGKTQLVKARLSRDRKVADQSEPERLTLSEVKALREARPHVEVPDEIVEIVLDLIQQLADEGDFGWAWADDRRFGRIFDVMQANALLDGRGTVAKQDLAVLEWLLWNEPGQIAAVKAKIAPFVRTPLSEAQEMVDALLSPSGAVEQAIMTAKPQQGVPALTQCKEATAELQRLVGEAEAGEATQIETLLAQIAAKQAAVIAAITGTNR